MCAIPLSFRFSLDFAYFSSILVLSRERQLGKENTYEKINHHHLRTYYDALHSAEPERRSTARDSTRNATSSDRRTGGASVRRKRKARRNGVCGRGDGDRNNDRNSKE